MYLTLIVASALAQTPTDCMAFARGAVRPGNVPDTLASSVRPLLVHYDAAYAPDQAAKAAQVLAAAELAWDMQVDGVGFRPPLLPDLAGGPEYDIYLVEYYQGTAFVAADDYSDDVVGDGYSGTSSYMVVDARLPTQWIDLYVAHEFNHASQWNTDFTEWTLPLWEGTATNAQVWTLGAADGKWDLDVADFQEASRFPALLSDSYYTYYGPGLGWLYEYGAALWVRFLDEKYGSNDGAMGVLLWDEAASEAVLREPDVVDAFAATAGTSLGDAMNHLAVVRFLTGDDWDARGLEDAAAWGPDEAVPASMRAAADLPLLGESLDVQPFVTGQVYVDVDLTGGLGLDPADGDPWLRVGLDSISGHETGVAVMWWDDAGQVGDSSAWGLDPEVEIPAEGLVRVAIGITNLGPAGWDGDENSYLDPQIDLTVEGFSVAARTDSGDTGTVDTGLPTDPTTTPGTTPPTTPTSPTSPTTTSGEPGSTGGDGTPDGNDGDDASKSGCGCQATGALSPLTGGLLGLLVLGRRRRFGGAR